jgi:flagellar basal body L-ring protein FlgH
MRKSIHALALLASLATLLATPGCGWIQSLRREVDDDDAPVAQTADFDYRAPENRYVPPPPANVSDNRVSALAGTPVDLSGTRAKHVRVTAKDFINENVKNENSLWAEDGQNNYFFAQNKLKNPGDLLSVIIEDGLRKDMVNSVRKLLPPEYRDQEIRVPGLTKDAPAADQRTPAGQAPPTPAPATASETTAEDLLTAEVLERYPNGNVRIRGIKRVPFKRQVRNIEVVAIVKGADISESDVVKSSKFFEQRVELYR